MRLNYFLLIFSVFATAVSFGQANPIEEKADTLALEEVVITGSKIEASKKIVPFSVSQINRKQVENTGQLNILPTLNAYVPGIFVTERNILGFGVGTGGAGSISMRGVASSPNTSVLILIDGHPQYQGIFGHPLADAYVASDIEKVEVIRGPASILYGSNAMAGVINLLTRKNEIAGFNGNVGASYGSFNTQKYFGTAGFKNKKWDLFASLNHDQTDGTRDSTDFNITNGYTKVSYALNDKLNMIADFNIAKYTANDNGPIFQPKFFNIDITRGKTSLTLANKFIKSEGALKLYHNFGRHHLSDGWLSTDRNSGLMLYQTFKLLPQHILTVGTDLKQYGGKGNNGLAKNQLKTVNELAAYIYTQQNIAVKLTISAGLRLEYHSVFGKEWVPLGGLAFNPNAFTSFKASVSKGFRSPTIMEMYLYAPNPDLKPERMINYEISWLQSFINNKMKAELTGFIGKGENMIQVVGIPPNAKRQNLGKFNNNGIEASVTYIPLKNLHIHSNYSYLHQQVFTLAAPKQQFNLNANYSYKRWNLFAGLQYIDKLYSSLTPVVIQSYSLANARLSLTAYKKLNLFVAGNNLLNRHYEINYGYPMPGANFSCGFQIKP